MEAKDDEAYMNWWGNYGEMADCNVEYPAWKAGRSYQHQFEKSAQQSVHLTAGTLPGHVKDCICAACEDNRRK